MEEDVLLEVSRELAIFYRWENCLRRRFPVRERSRERESERRRQGKHGDKEWKKNCEREECRSFIRPSFHALKARFIEFQ